MISHMTLIVKSFQAKDLPALDEDAANVFTKSERILLDHATKRFKNASELKKSGGLVGHCVSSETHTRRRRIIR